MSSAIKPRKERSTPVGVMADFEEADKWWDYEKSYLHNYGKLVDIFTGQMWVNQFGEPSPDNLIDTTTWNATALLVGLGLVRRDEPRLYKKALAECRNDLCRLAILVCQRDREPPFTPMYQLEDVVKAVLSKDYY